ncbi:hypothetical protein BSZ32_11780 [Rubritalea profundi]|uniref:EamA domain-containing protein n=2 Tax=Rubritalea profundi TaxID=1658618 RepID=A0A2S7U3Y0_9BACT|nr:hypothetical protein BSZ32_11780 [Rubritalea profundi]
MVILGSFLFCAKGIVVKLMFAEGLTPSGVMALRMLTATPVFMIMLALRWKNISKISRKDWGLMALLSFAGYFLCSLLNMTGLQYVSVGLERVILFSYPSIVLAGSILFQGARPSGKMYAACGLSWVGLTLIIREEISFAGDASLILLGSSLVLLSAIIYAGYILVAKPVIQRIGVPLYTGITMVFCAITILSYFSVNDGNFRSLFSSNIVIGYGAAIGIFGTVIPLLMLSYALSRINTSSYAIISSIGPVATILIATIYVGKMPEGLQLLGVLLSVAGGLLATKQGRPPKPKLQPAKA